MNVVEEKIDDLNAVLRITVEANDYSEKVDGKLKKYRKEANIPGFRPGKIPMGLIKKKFGKSVLADELNSLVNQSLNDFIKKNNLNILGQPLPKNDEEVKGDFNNPTEFEFAYEIGLAPDFEIKLPKKNKFDYLKIDVSDEMLDKEVDNLARRYGKLISTEKVAEKDMVLGEFTQKEGEISNNSTISLEFIEDDKVKKSFIGKKVGDILTIDPKTVSKDIADMAAMLAITEDEADELEGKFEFKITDIKNMIPAAIDQELFDKLFGEGNIKSEEELRAKIKGDLDNMFKNDSDKLFSQKVTEEFIFNIIMSTISESKKLGFESKNICFAGGVSLNSVAMGKVLKEMKHEIENCFIPPVPYDGGLTIGACQHFWYHVLGNPKTGDFISPYLGEEYSKEDTREAVLDKTTGE